MPDLVKVLFVGPQVPHERRVDEPGISPSNSSCRLAAHAAAVEGQCPGGGARSGGADHAPLHERVGLVNVVAAGPGHRHLVVGLALRQPREHRRLRVLEHHLLRHRHQLRVFEAAGEEGEGEVGALVDELEPDAALASFEVVRRVVGILILDRRRAEQRLGRVPLRVRACARDEIGGGEDGDPVVGAGVVPAVFDGDPYRVFVLSEVCMQLKILSCLDLFWTII